MPRPLIPQRRTKILDAAEAIIAERGFDALAMQEVAERAGIGKGAIYREFASKTELVNDLLARSGDRLWREVARRSDAADTRRLSEIFRMGMHALADDPIMLRAYTEGGAAPGAPPSASAYDERISGLTAYLAEMRRSGVLRHDLDPDAVASALVSTSIGLAQAATRLGGLEPERFRATIDVIADMIGHGLETGAEPEDRAPLTDLMRTLFEGGPRSASPSAGGTAVPR
ncbi:TetR/AcrR family transcriptional regulator [Actinomycetes bacterium KLBMP 9759]